MWEFHNKQMKELREIYNSLSSSKQKELQKIVKGFNASNINEMTTNKALLNEHVKKWKSEGILKGNFNVFVLNLLNRPAIYNIDMLHILITGTYYEFMAKAEERERPIFKEDIKHYYEEAQTEVIEKTNKGTLSKITDAMIIGILLMANAQGYKLEDYKDVYVSEEVQKFEEMLFPLINSGKEIDFGSSAFQKIFDKELNVLISVNGDKISGTIDNYMIGFLNEAKKKGYEAQDKDAKVRFIAVEDEKTTPMCHSLDGQEFYVNRENVYTRYYGVDKKMGYEVTMRTQGLVVGENLPPIDNYFHYCRSTIEYI